MQSGSMSFMDEYEDGSGDNISKHQRQQELVELPPLPNENIDHRRHRGARVWEAEEPSIAAVSENLRQLMIELQTKRDEITENKIMSGLESGWVEQGRLACQQAALAESGAHCAAQAARRLAEEGERATLQSAELKPRLDALTRENQLLTNQLRELRTDMMTNEKRTRQAQADRAAQEAVYKNITEKIKNIHKNFEDLTGALNRCERCVNHLEEEMETLSKLRDQILEERAKGDAAKKILQENLKTANNQIATLAAELGALKAKMNQEK